ncbi:MAG: hypothetical protein COA73_11865 [Candidatus Hydrogenedentota bacterium]|nr:MAG: hypothetical protein COA73_11865 [Candidatus Hydrogenedentota bacterium]
MKILNRLPRRGIRSSAVLLVAALAFVGCGGGGGGGDRVRTYNEGYADGFAQDSEYFNAYDDSWFTVGFDPILYDGDLIPFLDDDSYDAGFFDGEFDAYNDGYFVAYRYAFIIGFSEGYDNAFWADYLDFLANDIHIDYLNGGFSDGYNDGFSEGRIFGAFDYESFLDFDWLDAFLDWEAGTDLYFAEVDKGTGDSGPVVLYEWAQNPHLTRDAEDERAYRPVRGAITMRKTAGERNDGAIDTVAISRDLLDDQLLQLNVNPPTTSRTDRDLTLDTTWFERIDAFLNADAAGRTSKAVRN